MKTNFTLSLRILSVVFLLVVATTISFANDKVKPRAAKTAAAASNKSFRFVVNKEAVTNQVIDSALIILDKYDRTGAGVVMQMVKLDENNELSLTEVPEGKYFATIYTYGLKKERLEVVITVKNNKPNATKIKLAETEAYVLGTTIIPAEDIRKFSYVK